MVVALSKWSYKRQMISQTELFHCPNAKVQTSSRMAGIAQARKDVEQLAWVKRGEKVIEKIVGEPTVT